MAQRNRIAGPAENGQRVLLNGHVHPRAVPENDLGVVDDNAELTGLTLVLKGSAEQEAVLDNLLASQQDRSSPEYHQWLTPEQFAERFGASPQDIDKMTAWLAQQGLHINAVARGRNAITFTGTARNVGRAFQTQFHRYNVNGELHIANAFDPAIPAPMAALVTSIKGLNDFHLKPALRSRGVAPDPSYTSATGSHYLAPGDFAAVYDVKPLYAAGYNGAGQTIAVAGQTRVDMTDIQLFRNHFQLPANTPSAALVPGTRDPGAVSGDMQEADLDLEWAGAIAPSAAVAYVYSYDVMDAVQYIIDQRLAQIMSVSYGLCETLTAQSDALAMQTWARQGNAEGITWFNAAGDSGGADCVSQSSTRGSGASVDIPASIPEVTGVGGTTLSDSSSQYWGAANDASGASVVSYIPETVWNDSVPGDPAASGGGSSVFFTRPSWQTGWGVFDDAARSVPDVSLASSAEHNGYLVYNYGRLLVFGGTSAATPSLAGLAALLNQYLVANHFQGAPGLGNINPALCSLAAKVPSAFHDVMTGNNIVTVTCGNRARNYAAGSFGYNAGSGYDRASGLGSIDAYNFVLNWPNQ